MEEEMNEKENKEINEIEINAFYYHDSFQGLETSKNIYPLLLPSSNIIYIKRQIQKQQILIPFYVPVYYIHNNTYLKLWIDSKENLLYSITSISEPLFSKMLFNEDLYNIKINSEIEDNTLSLIVSDNNNTYKIKITDNFFLQISKYIGTLLGYALYILYIKPLLY
jgi:hypothetical protein